MKNFILRSISTILLSTFVVWLLNDLNLHTKVLALLLLMLISFLAVLEFHHFFLEEFKTVHWLCYITQLTSGVLFCWVTYASIMLKVTSLTFIVSYGIVFLVYSLSIFFIQHSKDVLLKVLLAFSPLLFFILPLYMVIPIYIRDHQCNLRNLLFLIAVTKAGDIGAYSIGVLTDKIFVRGNHKIFPAISPKKSLEGFIGGLAASVFVGWLIAIKLDLPLHHIIKNFWLLVSILLYLGAVFGDLIESLYKRIAMIKDSGTLIPGIGGILDLIDSLVFNTLIVYGIILI